MAILIACDGSCIQQGDFRKGDSTDRPGAAGFVADVDGALVGKATPHGNGLIGGMEVNALLMGLKFASELNAAGKSGGEPIRIVCDSQYAVRGFNEWLDGWAAKGYHKKGGLAYAEEWRAIDALKGSLGKGVEVEWTKGHTTGSSRESVMNRRVDELVNGAARSQQPYDDTHKVLPAAPATLAERYGAMPKIDIAPENAQRLYDAAASGLLVPVAPNLGDNAAAMHARFGEQVDVTGRSPAEAVDSVTKPFEPVPSRVPMPSSMMRIRAADGSGLPASARVVQETTTAREVLERADDLLPPPWETEKPAKPMSGIHAQALGLMAQAASDPELSGLIAQGLEMALDERRLTARYSRETVDAAQALQAALEKRGNER